VTAREKAGSDCKAKAVDSDRIETSSHCQKRLQQTTVNTIEIGKFVLTSVLTFPRSQAQIQRKPLMLLI
jgi:hypothetical protein